MNLDEGFCTICGCYHGSAVTCGGTPTHPAPYGRPPTGWICPKCSKEMKPDPVKDFYVCSQHGPFPLTYLVEADAD